MTLKDDIKEKVTEIIDDDFTVIPVSYVPDITDSQLTFGNKGLEFEATVLHIDMRGSTKILNAHQKKTVARIHKAYYYALVKIANSLNGQVRSFNGDDMIAFFQGTTTQTLSNAVFAALKMKYMLSTDEGIHGKLSKFSDVDYGIGIADGKILCAKIGMGGDNNNKDLFWAGNSVNKAVRLGCKGADINNIYISKKVYDNLIDSARYAQGKDIFGNATDVDMWTKGSLKYNDSFEDCYYTNYYMPF